METHNHTNLHITQEEHNDFLKEPTYEGRIKILLRHAEKNNLRIKRSKTMAEQVKTQEQIEKEMLELGDQFSEFLHTKGIVAKFKLAFANMGESVRKQHEQDKLQFEAEKAKFRERHEEATAGNADFIAFLHTKGFKAKCRLVIENIKKGAAESRQKTAEQIAKQRAQTQANIAAAGACSSIKVAPTEISAEELSREFNVFLKSKCLADEYVVLVENGEN